jgi:two-component system chemotaxis response regulator CheY
LKTLIVEDDFTSRLLLQKLLAPYGEAHIAVNGREAVQACSLARASGQPYDLICLDIMMPEMDGHSALKAIHAQEEAAGIGKEKRARVIMMTASATEQSVLTAWREKCDGYMVKPIAKVKLLEHLKRFELIDDPKGA